MITIRFTKQGTTPEQLELIVKEKHSTIKKGVLRIGREVQAHMRNTIKTSKNRKGGDGNLEKHIRVYSLNKGAFVGVGSFAELDTYAPYWYFLNYGVSQKGMRIPGRGKVVPGYFGNRQPPDPTLAGTGTGTEKFHYAPNSGYYGMRAKNMINPVNYIEKAKNWFNVQIRGKFDRWTKTTIR